MRHRVRSRMRRRVRHLAILGIAGAIGSAGTGAIGIGAAALFAAGRLTRRIVVEGRSMLPALEPGDRLLVVRLPRRWPLRAGDLVALRDPRRSERLLVKRVVAAAAGQVVVAGDNDTESTDSRGFGPVRRTEVWGRAAYRYAPAARAGRLRRSGASPARQSAPREIA